MTVWGFNDRKTAEAVAALVRTPQQVGRARTEPRRKPWKVGGSGESAWYVYTLLADMAPIGAPTAGETVVGQATADVVRAGAAGSEAGITLVDPVLIASHQVTGNKGLCVKLPDERFLVIIPDCAYPTPIPSEDP